MENIIKKSKEGGFSIREKHVDIGVSQLDVHYDYKAIVLDPLFWQALGKSCNWNEDFYYIQANGIDHQMFLPSEPSAMIAIRFYYMNYFQGWDSAVKWLEELVTKE